MGLARDTDDCMQEIARTFILDFDRVHVEPEEYRGHRVAGLMPSQLLGYLAHRLLLPAILVDLQMVPQHGEDVPQVVAGAAQASSASSPLFGGIRDSVSVLRRELTEQHANY